MIVRGVSPRPFKVPWNEVLMLETPPKEVCEVSLEMVPQKKVLMLEMPQ
jgi:hypothetical protein